MPLFENRRLPLLWLALAVVLGLLQLQLAQAQSHSNSTDDDDHDHDHHDDHDEHDHDEEHKAGVMKGVAILTISVLALSISAVVTFVPHFRTSAQFMTLMSSFAAGVFVLVGLCHMIPEGVEAVGALYSDEVNERFRPGYMMTLAGYFFMIFVQRGIFKVEHTHHFETVEKVQEIPMEAVVSTNGEPMPTAMSNPTLVLKTSENAPQDQKLVETDSSSAEKDLQSQDASPASPTEDSALLCNPSPFVAPPPEQGEGAAAAGAEPERLNSDHGHSHEHAHSHEHGHSHGHGVVLGVEAPKRHRVNTAALLGALIIHSLADGIAIGIQKEFRDVLVVYVAVIVHHWTHDMVFAYEAGLAIESKLFRMILCTIQSLVTAVGVGIGWALENNIPSAPRGFITAFCGGTFLMIGMTDLVPEEMMVGRRNLPQLLAFFIGAGTMYAVLAGAWTEAAHDHGDHDGHAH
jgi:zinc transporter ZupT